MPTKTDLEAQIKAESWQGKIVESPAGSEQNITRYRYGYWLKDALVGGGLPHSDLTQYTEQLISVADEGQAGEDAYFEGSWVGPLHNAFLRYRNTQISAPSYPHSENFIDAEIVEFTIAEIVGGHVQDTRQTGKLIDGELQIQ